MSGLYLGARRDQFEFAIVFLGPREESMATGAFENDRELLEFAETWLQGRAQAVGKNVRVCLTRNEQNKSAPFLAIMECGAFLDLLSTFFAGAESASTKSVEAYARKFLKTYPALELKIFWVGFRHKIAHLTHPYFVLDTRLEKGNIPSDPPRRIVWKVTADEEQTKLALELCVDASPNLTSPNPMVPWPVPYDHRFTIRPIRLQEDLRESLSGPEGYLDWLKEPENSKGRENFTRVIRMFFPPSP